MQTPLQITFHGMEPSDAVEYRIREKVAQLERLAGEDEIISCHVFVESPHRRHQQGNIFEVHIDLRLPDKQIVAGKERRNNHAHEDVYVSIRDAFAAAARRLEDYTRERRGAVKRHDVPDHGKVIRLDPDRNHGFIELPDGLEVYFHKNSVTNGGFEALHVGDEVRLTIADRESPKGPQASTVTALGKRHIVEDASQNQ